MPKPAVLSRGLLSFIIQDDELCFPWLLLCSGSPISLTRIKYFLVLIGAKLISRVSLLQRRDSKLPSHVGAIVHERYNGTVYMGALAQRTSLLWFYLERARVGQHVPQKVTAVDCRVAAPFLSHR